MSKNIKSLIKASIPSSIPEVAVVGLGTTAMVGLYVVTAAHLTTIVAAGVATAGCICVFNGCCKELARLDALPSVQVKM